VKARATQIEPNIYRYPDGRYLVRVSAAGRVAPDTRFPADTPIAEVRAWREQARARLTAEARALGAATTRQQPVGSLEGDAPDYLAQIAGRASFAADRSHLRAWFDVVVDGVRLGDRPRAAITTALVNKTIAQWQTAPSPHAIRRVVITGYTRQARGGEGLRSRGRMRKAPGPIAGYARTAPATSGRVVAALTIRHRCRVLDDLYRTLDGPEAASPVTHAKIPTRTKTPPPTVPGEVVIAVLRKLRARDVVTFARFYVACTTGQRPCQIGRARPEDLSLADRVWLVRDAKGEPAHAITLDGASVAAWQAFVDAEAWSGEAGGFDTTRYGKLIHAAGWPRGVRPYAARHSLAREAIKRGVSLGDVQALLGHADPATTRIYAPFQIERQRSVSTVMADYLADVVKPALVKG
jgi:integrase